MEGHIGNGLIAFLNSGKHRKTVIQKIYIFYALITEQRQT
jgi:hypothetical protein